MIRTTVPSGPLLPTTAIVTIVAKNYLAQARVLMDSVKTANPEYLRVVLLVDQMEGYFNPDQEDFVVVTSEVLGIPRSPWFHFKYSVLELSTAVKPYFLEWLIENYELNKIVYLDPDIRIYSSLDGVENALGNANIVLTPHLTHALEDDKRPSELDILRSGTYNLGFIGISVTSEVRRFLNWWQGHLYDHCVVDLARGFFVDQRWVDLVPGLFSGVRILRDDGYNAAYWNAISREITWKESVAFSNDSPLYFFHFSGYDPTSPDVLSKHQNRLSLQDRADLRILCDEYRQELMARGFAVTSRWPYTHARFRNGCHIPDIGRHLLGEAPHLVNEVEDPFSDQGFERMLELWNSPVSRSSNGGQGVTKLAYRVYRLREDVQAAMPDIFGADYKRFLEWLLSSAKDEHLLSEPFLRTVQSSLTSAQLTPDAVDGSMERSSGLPVICADLLNHQSFPNSRGAAEIAEVNQTTEIGGKPSHLTVLARYIYESRPDLQRVFPAPQGRDAGAYLAWLLNYGHHNYQLTEEFLHPMRQNLALIRAELGFTEKLRLDGYGFAMKTAFRLSPFSAALRNLTSGGKGQRRDDTNFQAMTVSREPVSGTFGVNVFGYFRAEMGVGQSARNGITALESAGIPYTIHNLNASELSEKDKSIAQFSQSAPHRSNLYFVNADQTLVVHGSAARSTRRHNIGFWTWELEDLPRQWDVAYQQYDEIWVPSAFCQGAIAARAPIPVVRVPYCISTPVASGKRRSEFGINPEHFVFLVVFDMRSCIDRKNPLAAIVAFKAAFPQSGKQELIIKVNHSDSDPTKLKSLKAEAAGFPIRFIEETFRHEDVAALLRVSDCIVSLHRSEGFGLVLAEAMLLEKPVITTGYSGNLDFCTPANSYLVSYKLQEVGPDNAPYPPSSLWADPSVEDAARQMQTVFENPVLRRERAIAGRVLIENRFSPAAVGAVINDRLQAIEHRH